MPSVASFGICREILGDALIVKTLGTCPDGAALHFSEDNFTNVNDCSEIRIALGFDQLKSLGLLPSTDVDGVSEMSVYDVGTLAGVEGSDLSDGIAFEGLSLARRGRATKESSLNLYSAPPNSKISRSFGAPERIINDWLDYRLSKGDVDAWMEANDNRNGRNACAIVRDGVYIYYKRTRHEFWSQRYSTYEKVEINKENWND